MNRTSCFPQASAWSKCLKLTLALLLISGMLACGGSSPSSGGGGGGGGGGGPACAMPTGSDAASQTTAPTTTNGVGQVGEATFLDMHTGSPNYWPSVPVGSLRLWDTGTQWPLIETSSGQYDWSGLDGFVSAAQAHNVDLLFNLARTPTWASSDPTDSSCSYDVVGEGGPGQCDPPSDLNGDGSGTDAYWIAWVTAIATRNATTYNHQIKFYEIWNEWNIALFWNPNAAVNPATTAMLVRMEQDARCVVEGPPAGMSCNSNSTFIPSAQFPTGTAIDPGAKIVTPSPVGAASFLDNVSKYLGQYFAASASGNAATGGQFADIIGFHGYVGTKKGAGICPIPEDVNTVVDDLANTAASTPGEGSKPWFDTEDSWSQAESEGFTDQDRQAAFLARYLILQRSLGVARTYWYRWDSTNQYAGALWTSPSGPISEGGTAFGEMSNWLVGSTISSACTPNGTVWTCSFTRPEGYQALAVWDASQDCQNGDCTTTTFTIPTNVSYTMQRDIVGNETSVSGTTVPIGAKPILLETEPLP